MRYLTSISLALIVLMALACTTTPGSNKSDSTRDNGLTRDLVKGLLNSYANSESAVGEGCLFLKYSEKPNYYLWERDSAALSYSVSNRNWVWTATGVGCSGIQRWEIDDTSGEVVHIPSPETAIVTPVPTVPPQPTATTKPSPTIDSTYVARAIAYDKTRRAPTVTPIPTPTPIPSADCLEASEFNAVHIPSWKTSERYEFSFVITNNCNRDIGVRLTIHGYNGAGKLVHSMDWIPATVNAGKSRAVWNFFTARLGANVETFEIEFD